VFGLFAQTVHFVSDRSSDVLLINGETWAVRQIEDSLIIRISGRGSKKQQ